MLRGIGGVPPVLRDSSSPRPRSEQLWQSVQYSSSLLASYRFAFFPDFALLCLCVCGVACCLAAGACGVGVGGCGWVWRDDPGQLPQEQMAYASLGQSRHWVIQVCMERGLCCGRCHLATCVVGGCRGCHSCLETPFSRSTLSARWDRCFATRAFCRTHNDLPAQGQKEDYDCACCCSRRSANGQMAPHSKTDGRGFPGLPTVNNRAGALENNNPPSTSRY